MTIKEKKDLLFFVGEKLYMEYISGRLNIVPAYEMQFINENTDILEYIKKQFIEPYDIYIKTPPTDNSEHDYRQERLTLINLINSFVQEYIKRLDVVEKEKNNMYKLFVSDRITGK